MRIAPGADRAEQGGNAEAPAPTEEAHGRAGQHRRPGAIGRRMCIGERVDACRLPGQQAAAQQQRGGGQQQGNAEGKSDGLVGGAQATGYQLRDQQQGDGRRRQAAGPKATDDAPIDSAAPGMDQRAARLGQRRVKQVGADCRRRGDAEQQHQQRRHQRAAADAGNPDDGADREAGEDLSKIHDASVVLLRRIVASCYRSIKYFIVTSI